VPGRREELTTWERYGELKIKVQKTSWTLARWITMRVTGVAEQEQTPALLEFIADTKIGREDRYVQFILCKEVPTTVRQAFLGPRQVPGPHAWGHLPAAE
jgi:hypothetical protein